VVICADREHTAPGYYKFSSGKISWSVTPNSAVLMTYAANDDDAAVMMFEKISNSDCPKRNEDVQSWLEGIFNDPHTEGLEMLIALVAKTDSTKSPAFYRTQQKKVMGTHGDYIGSANSSVLRYLDEILLPCRRKMHEMSVADGAILGAYYVQVANRFCDGCSGGPDVAALMNSGAIQDQADVLAACDGNFAIFETKIGDAFSVLLGFQKIFRPKQ